jgi:hypothetical protein
VTGLGEFSPIGRLFSLGSCFLLIFRISTHFCSTGANPTTQLIALLIFLIKIIFLCPKNALAYYNAGVVAVKLKAVGLAPVFLCKSYVLHNFDLKYVGLHFWPMFH